MEDFSNYLTSTPPDMQPQSPNQQQHSQSSMQNHMAMHHQQQQAIIQQMQQQQHHHMQQQQQMQTHQMRQGQSQQPGSGQSQLRSGPFAYPPPTAQSTPSVMASSNLTPRSLAEAMGIDSSVFSTELSFQLPSFLTGPTVAPGGGGDVVPGPASNLARSDSYSDAWYSGVTPNPHASGSDMNLGAGDYPGFSPYGIQSSQDEQYESSARERAGMNPGGFSQEEAYSNFTPGEMTLQSSQDVQPQLAQSSSMQPSSSTTYPPSNTSEAFQPLQIPRAPTQSPPQGAPIGPLPAATGTVMPGLYSTSGFDMLGVLARVASRPNPRIVLGPVDLTCSFTVVDVKRYDHPIVYASPTFHRLTGYEQHEIIGRNCRFLQAPNGKVERGSTRTYTDNAAVAHFKKSLSADKECQASLINYRKNGQPFINLVSIIPITWDSDDIRYHVGFQVDLVDQPHAILQTMRDGSYIVNYSLQSHPQPTLSPGRDRLGALNPELRRIIASTMSTGGFSGEEHERQDLNMMLLENSDDFIHVLSLRGAFLYVSPSVRHILEYEPEELIGKCISDVTHPSDIVPVMRELKDSSTIVQGGASGTGPVQKTVDLLLRVRRKTSGYVWIESQGRLHVEPGKGRKAIIMSGRKKEVPRLQWSSIARAGGLGDKEFWVQMSVDGLVLVASSGVHDIMGYTPNEFLGTSLIADHLLEEWKPSILARLAAAISPTRAISFASESARHPEANLDPTAPEIARCVMISRQGQQITVDIYFYPPLASLDDGAPGATPMMKSGPASLVCQIKVVSPDSAMGRSRSGTMTSMPGNSNTAGTDFLQSGVTDQLQGHIVHDLTSNVFEELETTRSTSWQYELQQLKISNRRMKDEVDSLVERLSGEGNASGSRRRRTRDTMESE
ncbi:White collar 1 protein (WC1) [Rhizoctonia solani]|uniref:White collar 1 protein (WC1) n=1 Tax=Rhizoctonia solani TaxID=456999 RepID=A0A8H7H8U4_9AGAM|nr:White collar 1 protein (WC1) [Rhizoctonia solani]